MADSAHAQSLEAIVRGVATANKTLRLYPPGSPMPRQAVEAAARALGSHLDEYPVLSLSVARDGFAHSGETVGRGTAGVSDLAEELRAHGVAEIDFTSGCSVDELLSFLGIVAKEPENVRSQGGLAAILAAAGVECVRVTDVSLTVVEQLVPEEDQDVDEFLRMLATDPDKLSTWMATVAAGDPAAFEEGLAELANVVGEAGLSRLYATLATAFQNQDPDAKDALLGLALEQGTTRGLTRGMFEHLGNPDIASALTEGVFGNNMLSLSNAISHLPLDDRIGQVYDKVQAMLNDADRSEKERDFLEHMMEVRQKTEPEVALVDADGSYQSVAQASALAETDIARMRGAVQAVSTASSSVTTMLALLDQQRDFELYCRTLENLAHLVPQLLEGGDLQGALRVIDGLSKRESRTDQPWPELSVRLREAVRAAVSQNSMRALIKAVIADRSRMAEAGTIMRAAGETAGPALVAEALHLKTEGLEIAEALLGRRIIDLLNNIAAQTQWFEIAPLVARLSRETDLRSAQTVRSVVQRDDDQSRREAAQGLSEAGSTTAAEILASMIGDSSAEVSIIAIRALAKCEAPESAALLSAQLEQLDIDGKDFALGREIIGALARVSGQKADQTLSKLSSRKALIKRGHFAEVQELARQALARRAQKGGAR